MLLEISPSIFEQSLAACQAGVIDATTLNSGLDYFLQPCLLFVLIGVVQYLCQEIVFSAASPASSTHHSTHGASSASSMMSPTGAAISPLASRGGGAGNSGGKSGQSSTSGKSVAMMQSSLKSLLAGEAFPTRLIRLLKSEISAALGHHAVEHDHQLAIIHERLAETSVNYDGKPIRSRLLYLKPGMSWTSMPNSHPIHFLICIVHVLLQHGGFPMRMMSPS